MDMCLPFLIYVYGVDRAWYSLLIGLLVYYPWLLSLTNLKRDIKKYDFYSLDAIVLFLLCSASENKNLPYF